MTEPPSEPTSPSGPTSGPRPPAWNRPQPPPPPPPPPAPPANVPISGELLPPGGYGPGPRIARPGMVPPPGAVPPGGVPGAGYGVPRGPQLPITKRIPDNLPFVARPSVLKRVFVLAPIAVVALAVFACPLGLALTADGDPNHTSGDVVALVGIVVCVAVVIAAALGLQIFLMTSGGPVLALAPNGLWIKTRPTRGQAVWLPWEGVEQIRRRRWGVEKMLVVKPRDPRLEGSLGAFTQIDSALLKLFYGSGFTATLNFADRSEDEILAAVRQFSNGRTPVNI
ncbi:hypothetical protein [Dactylosporangium sp. NPDC049140]|uniref:hypothetical protein n=1 Tax=Dactylosporangium sp. NPDC049140 TaxID=3155647 RepID=UPI0033D4B65D